MSPPSGKIEYSSHSPLPESSREVAQSHPTLSDPMDGSLPGSGVHGIFQTRVLEWAAIAFSFQEVLLKFSTPAL